MKSSRPSWHYSYWDDGTCLDWQFWFDSFLCCAIFGSLLLVYVICFIFDIFLIIVSFQYSFSFTIPGNVGKYQRDQPSGEDLESPEGKNFTTWIYLKWKKIKRKYTLIEMEENLKPCSSLLYHVVFCPRYKTWLQVDKDSAPAVAGNLGSFYVLSSSFWE